MRLIFLLGAVFIDRFGEGVEACCAGEEGMEGERWRRGSKWKRAGGKSMELIFVTSVNNTCMLRLHCGLVRCPSRWSSEGNWDSSAVTFREWIGYLTRQLSSPHRPSFTPPLLCSLPSRRVRHSKFQSITVISIGAIWSRISTIRRISLRRRRSRAEQLITNRSAKVHSAQAHFRGIRPFTFFSQYSHYPAIRSQTRTESLRRDADSDFVD